MQMNIVDSSPSTLKRYSKTSFLERSLQVRLSHEKKLRKQSIVFRRGKIDLILPAREIV
jgi:hypothetical protein